MSESKTGGPFAQEDESFASLFESDGAESAPVDEGQIVSGRVVHVGREHVVVDIGYKSEGIISMHEFTDTGGKVTVKVRDPVEVFVESRESDDGMIVLSKERADRVRVWDEIASACEGEQIIDGTVSGRVKGGLAVTIRGGVKAFLPGSQVDLRPTRNLDQFIGKTYAFRVIKFNRKRGNIVLSRRAVLEKERETLKAETLERLEEGMKVRGVIKNLTEYGAFVDLGGLDGLLHVTDMSWGRVNHPSELFKVGDEVTVMVLKFNPDQERVSLGIKQMQDDPWILAHVSYPVGARCSGKVVSLTDYGAFVELEPGVEGLIHISEMSWTKRVKHPSQVVTVGQTVDVVVLELDRETRRISLGLKQLEPDPWSLFTERHKPGDVIHGAVRSIADYGVFVEIVEGVDGMVHKSDISWTQRVNHPSELFRKGQEVDAVILNINYDEKKVSLGIKQLQEDPWSRIPNEYAPGRILEVKVIKVMDFGAFVELEPGVEGLIHVSEMSHDRVEDPRSVVNEGDAVKAEVITVDPQDRRIGLSMKTVSGREESQGAEAYMASVRAERRPATLGDLIREKLAETSGDEGTPAAASEEAPPETPAVEAAAPAAEPGPETPAEGS
jgi:small subunit ribosomal protein S1